MPGRLRSTLNGTEHRTVTFHDNAAIQIHTYINAYMRFYVFARMKILMNMNFYFLSFVLNG
jgi:hypothetical protein